MCAPDRSPLRPRRGNHVRGTTAGGDSTAPARLSLLGRSGTSAAGPCYQRASRARIKDSSSASPFRRPISFSSRRPTADFFAPLDCEATQWPSMPAPTLNASNHVGKAGRRIGHLQHAGNQLLVDEHEPHTPPVGHFRDPDVLVAAQARLAHPVPSPRDWSSGNSARPPQRRLWRETVPAVARPSTPSLPPSETVPSCALGSLPRRRSRWPTREPAAARARARRPFLMAQPIHPLSPRAARSVSSLCSPASPAAAPPLSLPLLDPGAGDGPKEVAEGGPGPNTRASLRDQEEPPACRPRFLTFPVGEAALLSLRAPADGGPGAAVDGCERLPSGIRWPVPESGPSTDASSRVLLLRARTRTVRRVASVGL
ncbi:hypothetical protein CDD83_1183 [Cordyceps sp. RAO-2017]|nr:hypothetical protein CDD83_1183 [Cordyceps sp. RAO-2017]